MALNFAVGLALMAGNDIERINEFVRNLTGRNESFDISKLSSAQKARLIAWADKEGISLSLDNEPSSQTSTPATLTANKHKFLPQSELSVGIDIQSRSELFPENIKDLKSSEELLKIFTLREIAYAENKPDPHQTLTGLFAAKEAIIKANSLSLDKLSEIEIEFNENGRPSFSHSEISISHSLDFAIAMAVTMTPLRGSEVESVTSYNNLTDQAKSTNNSQQPFNKTTKLKKQITKLFWPLLLIILALLCLGFGINFADKYM